MPKLIQQNGARVATGWPVMLHRYETGTLPDPADMLDCLLIVNDRSDGVPRARVVVSNGASYDTIAYLTDVAAAPAVHAVSEPQVVYPPLPNIAAEVSRQIALLRPVNLALPAPARDDSDVRTVLRDQRDQIDSLHTRVTALEGVIDNLHNVAMARIKDRT